MFRAGAVRAIPMLATGFLALFPASSGAGDFPVRSRERPAFLADVVAAPAEPGSVRVQVSWEIPHPQLTFRDGGDGWYRARYDVSVVFLEKARQVDGDVWSRRVRVKTLSETRDEARNTTGRRAITLPAASYRVRIRVTDRSSRLESSVTGTVRADLDRSPLGLGDLEFVRYREGVATRNASHEMRVGEDGHAVRIALHPERRALGRVRLHWKIRDPGREVLFEQDSTVVLAKGPLTFEVAIPTDLLTVGVHQFEMRVLGPGEESDRRTARLHVRLTPRWFETRREEALEVFELLARDQELDRLRRAEGAEWTARVVEFWRRRDPSPDHDGNEYRDEIQARMEAAATLFVEPFRSPGWRTDRGKVMVEFGAPARRSRLEGTFDRPASELWEYETPRRTFLFVDQRGSGEYWLQG